MGLKKEYLCPAHGHFEATEPTCPSGCTVAIERAFLTAPGKLSKKSSNTDRILNMLAKDYNLSDMSNAKGSVGASKVKDNPAMWGDMPKGNTYRVDKHGEEARAGSLGGATAAVAGIGGADASIGEMKLPSIKPVLVRDQKNRPLEYGTKKDVMAAVGKVA